VRCEGDFSDMAEIPSLNSSFATLAFFVVFRVLIKLFFSMDIGAGLSLIFFYRRRFKVKHGSCQTASRVPCKKSTENKALNTKVLPGQPKRAVEINELVKN
jgi:hypothetical protein